MQPHPPRQKTGLFLSLQCPTVKPKAIEHVVSESHGLIQRIGSLRAILGRGGIGRHPERFQDSPRLRRLSWPTGNGLDVQMPFRPSS